MPKTRYLHNLEKDPLLGILFVTYNAMGGVETRCRVCGESWTSESDDAAGLARKHAEVHDAVLKGDRFYFGMVTMNSATSIPGGPGPFGSWCVVACRRCHQSYRLPDGAAGGWSEGAAAWALDHAEACTREAEAARVAEQLAEVVVGSNGGTSKEEVGRLRGAFERVLMAVLR